MDNINRVIDHTLLTPEATRVQIDRLIEEALSFRFAAVCIHPVWVERVAVALDGKGVAVCAPVGFPLGANVTSTKVHEARCAVEQGATELDMVMALGAAKAGEWDGVAKEISEVAKAVPGVLLKVILETAVLTSEEIVQACKVAQESGAHFVKTSTGFGAKGATVEAVRLMRETVGPEFGVKASGGILDRQNALAMLDAGANRIGTSSSVNICRAVV